MNDIEEIFHNEKCQKASDEFGVGEENGAFKSGADWALVWIKENIDSFWDNHKEEMEELYLEAAKKRGF